MDIDAEKILAGIYSSGSLLLLYMAIFYVANHIYAKKCGYNLKSEIIEKDNSAVSLAFAGYLAALAIIFIGCIIGPSKGVLEDLVIVLKYNLLGILLLYVSHLLNDKVILPKFCNKKELTEDQNMGTAAVQAGSYISSGFIISAAIQGQGGGITSAIVFFLLGQLFLILMSKIYDFITPFDLHDEIEQDNIAAGVAFSGSLIALGLIMARAAGGDFISWEYNLVKFMSFALLASLLLPIFRTIFDRLILSNGDLNKEISNDKNTGAGLLEFSSTVAFAAVLCFLI